MSTFFSDYPHTDDETATAATRAALNGRRPDVVGEPTPRGWRLNLLAAGSVVGVLLLVVGGVCLGLLLGAQPESEGLTDAQLWTQNTDLMARSAFAVIALFLGGIMLLFVGAGHLYRQERREIVRALAELSQRIDELVGITRGLLGDVSEAKESIGKLLEEMACVNFALKRRSGDPADYAQGYIAGVRDRLAGQPEPPKEDA